MYTPVNPSFTIYKWGVRGCSLHGHVIMILCQDSFDLWDDDAERLRQHVMGQQPYAILLYKQSKVVRINI